MSSLKGKTLFITGASRGIGLAIGLRAARDGANVVIAAKSAEPHPKLPGTIYTAAQAIVEDAAYAVFQKSARTFTGRFLIDDAFLAGEGVTDFERYRVDPSVPLMTD